MAGYGSIGLTNAVQNFLRSKQYVDERDQKKMTNMLFGKAITGDQDALGQLSQQSPQMYVGAKDYLSGQAASQAEAQRVMSDERDKQDIMQLISVGDDVDSQNQILQKRLQDIGAGGGNAMDTQMLMNMRPDQRRIMINMLAKQSGIELDQQEKGRFQVNEFGVFDTATGELSKNPAIDEWMASQAEEVDTKTIRDISKDIDGIVKESKTIRQAAEDLDILGQSSSPSDQLAIIFKFMKALDPGSVVRSDEQVMLQKSGGLFDYMSNYINKLNTGEALSPRMINEIVTTAKRLSNSSVKNSNSTMDEYLSLYENRLNDDLLDKYRARKPGMFDVPDLVSTDEMSDDELLQHYRGQL